MSFADADSENVNTQVHFDTDSIFFVCDNSTTGHICNDLKKFVPGSLRQSNKSLTTANGTGPCLQEGTVRLQLVDDDGQKHTFILDNCLFHPASPVNLLSTRHLAKKFLDSNECPDEQTRIESRFLTHILTWSFGNFKKTFPTPVSGLPELLFDEGFLEYKSFCTQVSSFAAASGTDARNINIIPFGNDEVQPMQLLNDEADINTLFMINETVLFKDGKGITREVTYLGSDSSSGMLKHRIKTHKDTKFLVGGILLSSLDAPDIGNVPVSVDQYAVELPKLTCQQLDEISNPQTLDSDQRKLMNLHYKMNHLPLPALISLLEKG
jgi:hypothetical protein